MKFMLTRTLIILIATVLLAFTYLKWSFWEPSDIKRNSLIYWLKVPNVARDFPVWDITDEATFDVRIADGLKPSFTIVEYSSSNKLDDLITMSKQIGFNCKLFQNKAAVCDKEMDNGKFQQINMTNKTSKREITIVFGGY